jgi:hypothetical protein
MPLGLVLLMVVLLALGGCTSPQYQEVPECTVAKPPKTDDYLNANPDERLVVMSNAYIHQVKSVTRCNNNIRAINARNKARTIN